jgi:hypothetical protein
MGAWHRCRDWNVRGEEMWNLRTFGILSPCNFEKLLDICYFGGHLDGGVERV